VEVFLFILLFLGVYLLFRRRRLYNDLSTFGQLSSTGSSYTNFNNVRSILDELAGYGWSKNRSTWCSNFSLNPKELSNASELDQVVRILLDHARQVAPEFSVPHYIPRTISTSMSMAAGQFEVDEKGWVTIRVSPDFCHDRLAAQAILAHEACHYILGQSGIWHRDTQLNERYTDLCMFICGFGQVFLKGYKRDLAQSPNRQGHRLGYLTDAEYRFASQYVAELRQTRGVELRYEIDGVKRRLLQLVRGDEEVCRWYLETERKRNPHKSEAELYQDTIDRLEWERRR
jgi:hypothetical protein